MKALPLAAVPTVLDGAEPVPPGTAQSLLDAARRAFAGPGKSLVAVCTGRTVPGILAYVAALEGGHAVLLKERPTDSSLTVFQPEYVIDSGTGPIPEGYRLATGAVPGARVLCRQVPADSVVHPDLAVLLTTSGSLGSPKAVRLSYANIASNAQAIIDALGLRPTDVGITSLPSDYSFGLSVVNTHLFAGAPLVVSRLSPTAREFWRLVKQTGVTDFGAVPLSYRLLHSTNWHAGRFPQLRLAYQAGGALEPELVTHFSRMLPFCTMYGATEATARMACLPPPLQAEHLGSVGKPVLGGRIRLEDGEIVYQGPNVMMGYARSRSDLADGDTFGDVLHTGDLGRIDRGMLYVLGRKDRQLKLHGKKIAAEDVEQRFAPVGSAAVITSSAEAAVVFIEGSATAYRPVWFEVLRSLELPAECLRLRPVARLPRTRAGKVDFGALRELVATP